MNHPEPATIVPHARIEPDPASSHAQPSAALRGRYGEGQVLAGKYQLTCVIGEGGMGAVWLARHVALEQHVAIKLVRHETAGAEASARLHREALAAARVRHPAIVQVFDFGTTEHGDPYIVMELVQGESLAEVLARRAKLEPNRAVQLLLPVIDALACAHEQGIVHRDVKPENIALVSGANGTVQPKLVDFGIAKLGAAEGPRAPQRAGAPQPLAGLAQTRLGAVVGSPSYLSPEQALGSAVVEPRTDVWQICVVLYEAVAGRLPFHSEDLELLLLDVLTRDPPPIAGCDETLWRIVRRGLEKRAGDRWPDMRALGGALAQWLAAQGGTTDATGAKLSVNWLGARPTLAPPGGVEGELAAPVRQDPTRPPWAGLARYAWLGLVVAAASLGAAGAVWAVTSADGPPSAATMAPSAPTDEATTKSAAQEPEPIARQVAVRPPGRGLSAPPSLGGASSAATSPAASAPPAATATPTPAAASAAVAPSLSRSLPHAAAPADPGF
ncbi:MAG: serine/threonine protein kinase [Myxococcales bacterium]|nr:serine/threonine protein kinase [Myxococcales bacterium]